MQKYALAFPLDWDDARMFLAVARAGQMLGAARTLGVNQATLSRRMASLEGALGAKLLLRRTHGSELTDAGATLLETLERVETEMLSRPGASPGRRSRRRRRRPLRRPRRLRRRLPRSPTRPPR